MPWRYNSFIYLKDRLPLFVLLSWAQSLSFFLAAASTFTGETPKEIHLFMNPQIAFLPRHLLLATVAGLGAWASIRLIEERRARYVESAITLRN